MKEEPTWDPVMGVCRAMPEGITGTQAELLAASEPYKRPSLS